MMNRLKPFLPHAVAHVLFFVVASAFFSQLYQGKELVQSDRVQLSGIGREVREYRDKGETILWTNTQFSGLPELQNYKYNFFRFIHLSLNKVFKRPVLMMLILFSGFYIFMQVMGVPVWLSAIGAFCYAFGTFNVISIEAGHDNKVFAMGLMAPVLAGMMLCYRGRLFMGGSLLALSLGLQIYYAHIQISYYLLMAILVYVVIEFIMALREKRIAMFLRRSVFMLVVALIAVAINLVKLGYTWEYGKSSNRGGSELTKTGTATSKDGLDKGYALQWSEGQLEVLTVMFPYFHGGASAESLEGRSNTAKVLRRNNVDPNTSNQILSSAPLYWGDQPFTAGPVYFGIVLVFLFAIGIAFVDKKLRIWSLVIIGVTLLLSMGKNVEWFTNIFFYNVPLYNKFRSVTMILALTQLMVAFVGVYGFSLFLKAERARQLKILKISGGIMLGVAAFFYLLKDVFFEFSAPADQRYLSAGYPDWLIQAFVDDRIALFNGDLLRSAVFVILVSAAVWLWISKVMNEKLLIGAMVVLCLADLWVVNKRYIHDEKYQRDFSSLAVFQPSAADQQIMNDKDYFRVYNTTVSPFQDGVTSYFHNSIGGYSAIKLQRYQELFEGHISQGNQSVFDMLNVKYFISGDARTKQASLNRGHLGNAWLIKQVKSVTTVDDELEALNGLNPAEEVVVNEKYDVSTASYSGQGSVSLTNYHPDEMTYAFSSTERQFVVFSEIYYQPGWKAYVDGVFTPHYQVNYVLRGMEVAAGDHEIVFRFSPPSYAYGTKISLISSLLLIGFVVIGFTPLRKRFEEGQEAL